MQAIARVNRTFRDKPGGLVVDYIGIAETLQAALADYTDRDRARQEVGAPIDEALAALEETPRGLCELLYGCPWREALDSGADRPRLEAIMEALEHLLGGAGAGAAGPVPRATPASLSQAFTLAVSSPRRCTLTATTWRSSRRSPSSCAALGGRPRGRGRRRGAGDRDPPGRLRRRRAPRGRRHLRGRRHRAARTSASSTTTSPHGSSTNPHPNLQIELLKRLLTGELRTICGNATSWPSESSPNCSSGRCARTPIARSTPPRSSRELVELAKQMQAEQRPGCSARAARRRAGLLRRRLPERLCASSNSATTTLKQIAHELVAVVRRNATVDWDKKEQVRALLRSQVRRLLDEVQVSARPAGGGRQLVMQQAELLAGAVL